MLSEQFTNRKENGAQRIVATNFRIEQKLTSRMMDRPRLFARKFGTNFETKTVGTSQLKASNGRLNRNGREGAASAVKLLRFDGDEGNASEDDSNSSSIINRLSAPIKQNSSRRSNQISATNDGKITAALRGKKLIESAQSNRNVRQAGMRTRRDLRLTGESRDYTIEARTEKQTRVLSASPYKTNWRNSRSNIGSLAYNFVGSPVQYRRDSSPAQQSGETTSHYQIYSESVSDGSDSDMESDYSDAVLKRSESMTDDETDDEEDEDGKNDGEPSNLVLTTTSGDTIVVSSHQYEEQQQEEAEEERFTVKTEYEYQDEDHFGTKINAVDDDKNYNDDAGVSYQEVDEVENAAMDTDDAETAGQFDLESEVLPSAVVEADGTISDTTAAADQPETAADAEDVKPNLAELVEEQQQPDHYACGYPECNVICDTIETLRGHIEVDHLSADTKERKLVCDICGKRFANAQNRQRHAIIHTDADKPFACDVCEKRFVSKQGMLKHQRSHFDDARPFRCDVCEKPFASQQTMEIHHLSHVGQKPFVCEVCERGFVNRQNLQRHQIIHSQNAQPFGCALCTKRFSTKQSLQMHLLRHTGEKPHECRTCGKSFADKRNLRVHEHIHNGGRKPYECEICHRWFSTKTNLREHSYNHSGEPFPYECKTCGKRFKREQGLRDHESSQHGNKGGIRKRIVYPGGSGGVCNVILKKKTASGETITLRRQYDEES